MSNNTTEYLSKLVERINGLKNPTNSEQLIVRYYEKENLTKEEKSLLDKLVRAEKKAEQYHKAKADVAKALNAEKEKERKAVTQRKIIVGGALMAGATKGDNIRYYQEVMRKMLADGLIGERDKSKFEEVLKSLPTPTRPIEGQQQVKRAY